MQNDNVPTISNSFKIWDIVKNERQERARMIAQNFLFECDKEAVKAASDGNRTVKLKYENTFDDYVWEMIKDALTDAEFINISRETIPGKEYVKVDEVTFEFPYSPQK